MADIISFADYIKNNNIELKQVVNGDANSNNVIEMETADIDIQYEEMKKDLAFEIKENKDFLKSLNMYVIKMCYKLGDMYAEQFNTHPDLFGITLAELLTKNKATDIKVKEVKEQMKKDGYFIK